MASPSTPRMPPHPRPCTSPTPSPASAKASCRRRRAANPAHTPARSRRSAVRRTRHEADIITNLPVANSGHESNGLAFGPDGRLYIAQGGTTNAGVIDVGGTIFQREETALGGAMLVADVKAAGFNGNVTYSEGDVYSSTTNVTGGHVSVYASGLRNPYDVVFHSNGRFYVTDNGPNDTYGPGSTGCAPATDTGVDAATNDEINVVVAGAYYGHPNRNRGRTDPRQCSYYPNGTPSGGGYTGAMIANLPASSDGMVEYTSNKFAGQMQGDLLFAAWVNSELRRIKLSPDGLSVVEQTTLATGLVERARRDHEHRRHHLRRRVRRQPHHLPQAG